MDGQNLDPQWLHWPQTQKLVAAFAAQPDALRFVGGAVRDAFLKRPVQDVDAATTLVPQATMALLAKAGIRAIPTGIEHGTVTAVIDGKHFEITTLRRDVSTDGRHAEIEYTDDWKEDAKRRDFTINALYLSTQGELFDYFGGVEDVKKGVVRFIGDANQRIAEDYLRILRFFRFYAHYGKGVPEAAALTACTAQAQHMAALSGERIQQEMFKLLAAPQSHRVVKWMIENGILDHVLGVHVDNVTTLERLENTFPDVEPITKLTALIGLDNTQALEKVIDRLKLSNALAAPLEKARYITPDQSRAELYQFYIQTNPLVFGTSVAVSAVSNISMNPHMHKIEFYPPPSPFPVKGEDLIAFGMKPGKEMGDLLRSLENEWANSDYKLTKEELLAKVKQ